MSTDNQVSKNQSFHNHIDEYQTLIDNISDKQQIRKIENTTINDIRQDIRNIVKNKMRIFFEFDNVLVFFNKIP